MLSAPLSGGRPVGRTRSPREPNLDIAVAGHATILGAALPSIRSSLVTGGHAEVWRSPRPRRRIRLIACRNRQFRSRLRRPTVRRDAVLRRTLRSQIGFDGHPPLVADRRGMTCRLVPLAALLRRTSAPEIRVDRRAAALLRLHGVISRSRRPRRATCRLAVRRPRSGTSGGRGIDSSAV